MKYLGVFFEFIGCIIIFATLLFIVLEVRTCEMGLWHFMAGVLGVMCIGVGEGICDEL